MDRVALLPWSLSKSNHGGIHSPTMASMTAVIIRSFGLFSKLTDIAVIAEVGGNFYRFAIDQETIMPHQLIFL
ncbi:MAG: hypothetical protein CSB22_00155 [Deltaproteobacteria bacterium]|nr:MAG: hypothetical protein CSB22_00155 [Deltaproteobacteria bacterium]